CAAGKGGTTSDVPSGIMRAAGGAGSCLNSSVLRRAPLRVAAPRGSVGLRPTAGSGRLRLPAGSGRLRLPAGSARLPSGAPCGKRRAKRGCGTPYARCFDSLLPTAHSHGKGSGERPPTQAAANGGRPLPAGEAPPGAFAASRREPQATASRSRPQADASPRRSDAKRSAPHCHRLPPDLPPVTSPGDSRMRGTVHWLGLIALAAMMACSGDDPTDPGAVCDVTNPVVQIAVSPSMDTVHIRIPARPADAVQLTAVVTGRAGNARTDVPVAFSSSDTTIATVTSTGLVQLR